MTIFRKKELYLDAILTFLIIVLIDWFMEIGFSLFKGDTFSQTIRNFKIPFTYLGPAFAIVYFNLKKRSE
jgi:hypothetical protein